MSCNEGVPLRQLTQNYGVRSRNVHASAFKSRDGSAITSLFAGRNILLMPPNEAAAVGPEAIKARYSFSSRNPVPNLPVWRISVICGTGLILGVITASNSKLQISGPSATRTDKEMEDRSAHVERQ